MYNFYNLNDYEFEILCKDIMEQKLNVNLRVYKTGRDGGIDINAFTGNDVVIQVKHYIKSSYSGLKTALSHELNKVKILNPGQYFICTSQQLSVDNVKEIYELFKDYMRSSENIIDGTQINELLKLESSMDIVKKNYKLWLASSNILDLIYNKNILIDSEELIYDIESESKFYVETESYLVAKKILNNEKIIIIQGDPGVGKSTLSKMLILNYVAEGYSVRYSTDNDISNIKKALSLDVEKKEIVLLDDFLGQHYLKLRENQPNEIKTLISFVRRHNNKKLILNTRITILNEAKRANLHFKNLLDDKSISQYLIDLNKMKKEEKAKIFYNHIYFNNLPREYFNEIKLDRRYLHIITHKNYNPRIIQYITKERNYKSVKPMQYYQYIINKLDNPQDVWEDEFVNRIEKIDREFMNTLYSLTNNYVENNVLKECFYKRINVVTNGDSTLNTYEIVIKRLSNALIKIVDDNGVKKIGTLNPSINDYMNVELDKNENEVRNILNSAVYLEQVLKFSNKDFVSEWIKKSIVCSNFLNLKTLSFSIEYFYLTFIVEYKVLDKNLEYNIKRCIEQASKNLKNKEMYQRYSNIIIQIFSEDFIDFYKLDSLIFDIEKMSAILDMMEIQELIKFIKYINKLSLMYKDNIEDVLLEFNYMAEPILKVKIVDEIISDYEDKLDELVYQIIDDTSNDDKEKYYQGISTKIDTNIKETLMGYINNDLDEYLSLIKEIPDISIGSFNIENIVSQLDYEDIIYNYFQNEPDYDYDDDYRESSFEDDTINHIFEREYD